MGVEQAVAAVRFEPLLPPWLLGLLAAISLAALLPAVWRRARGSMLRVLCFALLLLWLAGPRLVQETREMLPDIGLLVVDQTASMQVGQRTQLAEAARAAIEAQAAKLPDLELRTITVPESGNAGTQLFGAMRRALAEIPQKRLAGVIAVTDGQVHDLPPAAQAQALLGGAPLHLLIPAKGEETDRRLRVIEAPSYGIVGRSVTLRVAIDDLGVAHPGGAAGLTIRRDGEPSHVDSVPIGREQVLEFPMTRAGPTVIDLQAEKLPGEVSTLNNRAVVSINGVRDRLRVLLISGEPHQGERTWRRLLKADPSVDLVHFTILRPPEKDDLTPLNELALIAFPVRELFQEKIKQFDLIILDRFQNRGLLPVPYLRNIAEYVEDGGALLLSVGPEFAGGSSIAATPLGGILPAHPAPLHAVIDGPFRPRVSDLGMRHPVTTGLAGANGPGSKEVEPGWGSWYRRIEPVDVHGQTLLSSPEGDPLLVLDRIGQGRVALLLSDQIWLWSRGHQGGGPQAELLRRVAHWAMQQPELEEDALTARVEHGKLLIERRSTKEGPPGTVKITDPDGRIQNVPLARSEAGNASAAVPAPAPGLWQVSDGARTAYAAAEATNPLEFADLRATASVLGTLARESGGSVHWLDNGTQGGAVPELRRVEATTHNSGANWIGLQRRYDHLTTGIATLALLPAWLALPALLGLAILAWRREGT
ncbi:MAG: hypothetical protein JOY71_09995 [Acetobacteraceae bacterium]|nr:hypothetical protein [Acetobacteraceae bacterium]